ncbi:Uncharacterised protein [Mycobacterium tuberculosis]|nr:Uncharacterised protein [Mycobacterium tuberculosis]
MVARQSGEDFFKRIYRILCRRPAGLGIQAGELILSILLDTRPSPDLPAGGNGDRARRNQNQIRDAETVRTR